MCPLVFSPDLVHGIWFAAVPRNLRPDGIA
jgi:hypothetical protein